jgi:hypothetical protein
MPIVYKIDLDQRIVFARGTGVFGDDDVFRYQKTVWSRREVQGFDELVDMTRVERLELPSPSRMVELAALSAHMEPPDRPSKLAIVATEKIMYGLGRMYEANRESQSKSTKEVRVFWSMSDALTWLDATEPKDFPPA